MKDSKGVNNNNNNNTLLGNRKTVEQESDGNTICNWYSWYSHQRIGTMTGGLGNNSSGGDCPNYSIILIVQNTEKRSGDLRRLALAKTPVKDLQLTLM